MKMLRFSDFNQISTRNIISPQKVQQQGTEELKAVHHQVMIAAFRMTTSEGFYWLTNYHNRITNDNADEMHASITLSWYNWKNRKSPILRLKKRWVFLLWTKFLLFLQKSHHYLCNIKQECHQSLIGFFFISKGTCICRKNFRIIEGRTLYS